MKTPMMLWRLENFRKLETREFWKIGTRVTRFLGEPQPMHCDFFWEIPSKITSSICIKLHFAPKNGSWIFMMFLWCWSLFQAISRGPKKGSAKKVRIYMDPWYHYNIEGITQTPYTPHSQVVFVDSTRCLLAEILLVTRAPKWLFSFNASTVSGCSRAPGGEQKHEMPVLVLYVIDYMYTWYINILNNIYRIHKIYSIRKYTYNYIYYISQNISTL